MRPEIPAHFEQSYQRQMDRQLFFALTIHRMNHMCHLVSNLITARHLNHYRFVE